MNVNMERTIKPSKESIGLPSSESFIGKTVCVAEVCIRDSYKIINGELKRVGEICPHYKDGSTFPWCSVFNKCSCNFIGPFNGWNTAIPLPECIEATV